MPPAGSPIMLGVGFLLAALGGWLGWRTNALTGSGAIGATLIGGFVFGFGGLTWAVLLVAFFVASSLLSRLGRSRKRDPHQEKAGPRDLAQTLANGGVALLMALAVGLTGHDSHLYPFFTLAYFGSLAAVTADTWATELGMLSPHPPRLITTGEVVPPGMSGGISSLGLIASLAGGLFIGLVAFVTIQAASLLSTGEWFLQDWFLLIILPMAGFLASSFDSFLGATMQRLYYCERCQELAEQPIHHCGVPGRLVRGYPWMNNDLVNFLAACVGAVTAILFSYPFLLQ